MPNYMGHMQHGLYTGMLGGTMFHWDIDEGVTGKPAGAPIAGEYAGVTGSYELQVGDQEWISGPNGTQLAGNFYTYDGATGSVGYVQVADTAEIVSPVVGDYTIALWAYPVELPAPNTNRRFFTYNNFLDFSHDVDRGTDGFLYVSENLVTDAGVDYTITQDQWTWFGVTRQANVGPSNHSFLRFYVNGLLIGTYERSYTKEIPSDSAYNLLLPGWSQGYMGLCDVTYVNGYRCSDEEMLQMYNYLGD